MIIVEEFAAEFKVKLVAEPGYAFQYVFRLDFEILLVVKTIFHNGS